MGGKNAILCVNKTIARLQDRLGTPTKTYGLVRQHRDQRRPAPIGRTPAEKKTVHANWLVVFPGEWRPEGVDLVGQLKAPRNFDPTDVVFINPADEDADCGTYAWQAECRYLFLVTVEYVTVLRFHVVEEGRGPLPNSIVIGVEYDYFPYSNHGEQELTLCKVIWALTLMAQNPGHRDIVPRRRMLPLNSWYAYTTAGGRTYYVHHISEIIRDAVPGNGPKIMDISRARDQDLIQRIASRLGGVDE
ncbi:hypothetical protein PG988_004760 [Apiospora saccharicola]